jgi:hypothetical protein
MTKIEERCDAIEQGIMRTIYDALCDESDATREEVRAEFQARAERGETILVCMRYIVYITMKEGNA